MAVPPGQTATTSESNGVRSIPGRVSPTIELPSDPAELASRAAPLLGWQGTVLPQLTLFGRRVFVVARLRPDAHAERIATGLRPVTDRATVATWTWPELARVAPPPAVHIAGVLAVARHWRTGMAAAVPFARYGEAAMVLPTSITMSHDYVDHCLPRARMYGIGTVAADENATVDLDVTCGEDRIMLGDDEVWRWVHEVAYERLLACEAAGSTACERRDG
ncbi:hypothetical protein B1813_14490 [Saccharomonospora piscinae]|uniref:Uncharacterized protein n=1 Tax=Saccharomonospora piscinae TaxID=687388 RepID=A0A1V9A2F7_SACPI|nr:hypothetical protein [Saccharomonospora piscinae]OQO91220.1 hypothetical protein B1813_14490 [Saccharomonospora piscinae]TLW93418.1 hypothetical protein FFT09_08435 [Saccharomonospora piscinae]